MAEKVILDVDTGSDDAVAIMTAALAPEIDLVAVCTVAGNKPLDLTTENTLRVLDLLGMDIPVYRGCPEPLVKFLCNDWLPPTHRKTASVDGKKVEMHSDYLALPPSSGKAEEMPAPAFYVEYLRKAQEPVTLVAVGPLTNLATAFIMDPGIIKNIKQIVVMGGGYNITNASPSAEFNIWYDPEAAQRVVTCGAETLLVPLDATHAACVTLDDCKRFRDIGTGPANFTADLCEQRILVHTAQQPLAIPDAAAVHDALAVCSVIDRSVLKDVRHVHCDIGFRDFSAGQTIIDPRYYPEKRNCYFAFDGDRFKFVDMLCRCFKSAI
jgi:inosine-uridine nucleoside N-ribohydrolase